MNVFSKRYAELINTGNGMPVDNICGEISSKLKEQIFDTLCKFSEPQIIYPDRYSSYNEQTTAYHEAVKRLNDIHEFPVIETRHNVFDSTPAPLSCIFTPYLFDLIELQYDELSQGERLDFQNQINGVFANYDVPWLIYDGHMIKIDAKQFEFDIRAKAISALKELKAADPKFQSAYEELFKSFEFLEKGNFAEAISNAGKSYESVLKIICGETKGNADKLTTKFVNDVLDNLPQPMTTSGFREKVMMSLPFIRNNSSADHGAGELSRVISKPLAKLSLNLAAALNTYLIEEYIDDVPKDNLQSDQQVNSEELPF
ncbi:hypothetical protein V6615_13125 [Oscillospiraceae bacterium PP1C4]